MTDGVQKILEIAAADIFRLGRHNKFEQNDERARSPADRPCPSTAAILP